jgi:hypothetical protein
MADTEQDALDRAMATLDEYLRERGWGSEEHSQRFITAYLRSDESHDALREGLERFVKNHPDIPLKLLPGKPFNQQG